MTRLACTLVVVALSVVTKVVVTSSEHVTKAPPTEQEVDDLIRQTPAKLMGPECMQDIRRKLDLIGLSVIHPFARNASMCRCFLRNCPPAILTVEEQQQLERNQCALAMQQTALHEDKQRANYYAFSAAYVIVFVIGLLGNAMVLIVLLRYLPVRNPSNIFITSLTVSDLAMVIICLPIRLLAYVNLISLPTWACYITVFVYRLIFASSVFTMCALGIERYIAICLPLKAKSIATTKHARLIVMVVWCLAAVASIPAYVLVISVTNCLGVMVCEIDTPSLDNYWFYCYWFVALFCLPIIILTVVYTVICRTLYVSIREKGAMISMQRSGGGVKVNSRTPGGACSKEDPDAERKQVIIMIIVLMVVFTLCWGPLLTANMLTFSSVVVTGANQTQLINNILYLVTFFNPCLDPLIYGIFSNQFKRGYMQLLRQCVGVFTGRSRSQRSSDDDTNTVTHTNGLTSSTGASL